MPSILDINLASTTLLEEYESKGYSDLVQSLLLANDIISARILKTKGVWTKSKLNEIKRLIDDEITKAYGGLFEAIQDESKAIAQINMNAVLGYSSLATALPKEAINNLINSNRAIQMGFNNKTNEVSMYTFKELFKLSEDLHARQLKVTIAGGVASGLTAPQIVKQFDIKSDKLSKGQIKSNIFTVITDSKNQGNYEAYKELEKRGLIKYYEHVSTLDSDTSPICRKLDGRKYYKPLDEIPDSLKPVLHSHCRSQLVARTTEDKQLRASQSGAVPDEKYPEWFDKQPDSFKRSVLGNKYKLYRQDNYKIESMPDVLGSKKSLKQYQDSLFDFVKG